MTHRLGSKRHCIDSGRMHGRGRYCTDWVGYMDAQVVNTSTKDLGEDAWMGMTYPSYFFIFDFKGKLAWKIANGDHTVIRRLVTSHN